MLPLQAAFGWSTSELMTTTSFTAFGGIFSSQLAGHLNKRFGMRIVALWSFLGLFVALLCITQIAALGGSIWVLYAFFALLGFAGVGTLQVTWTQLVNGWFDKNRGLALAIVLSGSGFMGVVLPTVLTLVTSHFDWRAGFVVLAILPVAITLPLAYIWLRELPHKTQDGTNASNSAIDIPGVSYAEGIRDWRFWVITLAIIMVAAGVMVVLVNSIPILVDKGYTAIEASKLFGVFGLSLVFGRIITGLLIDRLWAPAVACVVFLLCAVGCFLLATVSDNTSLLIVAVALVGIGGGAEFDISAFLIVRYFGMRDYSRLFGLHLAALSAGICAAPFSAAISYKLTESYHDVLVFYACLFAVSALLLLTIGRYPRFSNT